MKDTSRIYLTYEVSGMHVCDDLSSPADDIVMDLIETVPNKEHNLVGHIELTRIPSDLRSINADRVADGYGMANIMMGEQDSRADIIAQEMNLMDPDAKEPYIKALKGNDLYVIKFIAITKNRREDGYGSYALSKLPAALKRITNDQNPVIAVVPAEHGKDSDLERAKDFFKKNGYKKVCSCAQTWYYC